MVGGHAAYLLAVRPPRTTQGTPEVSEYLTDDTGVERALRVGLDEFDLSEEDRSLIDGEYDERPSSRTSPA